MEACQWKKVEAVAIHNKEAINMLKRILLFTLIALVIFPALTLGINVADFGAVGDGIIDDTAAIQAAIDDAEAQWRKIGGVIVTPTVHIQEGVYAITGLLVEANVTIKGAGMHSTVLVHTGNRPAIDIAHIYDKGAGHYQKDAMQFITDLTISGHTILAEGIKPDQIGIRVNADCVSIRDVWVNRMSGSAGILLSAGISSVVVDCFVTECYNGNGIEATAALRRIPCVDAGGVLADGDTVVGATSGQTAIVRHYYPETLCAPAGDIELYNVSGTFTKGERIEKAGDPTAYITVADVGRNAINEYYLRFNTTPRISGNKFRWNKCGILIDSVAWPWITDNLIESNITGSGSQYGTAGRPGIALELRRTYNPRAAGARIFSNYYENHVSEMVIAVPGALIAYNSHAVRKQAPDNRTTKSTDILVRGYRCSISHEQVIGGLDGVFNINARETLIESCVWGSGANRQRVEERDLQGRPEHVKEAVLIDHMLDGKVADSRAPRAHRSYYLDALYSLSGVPMSAQNFQSDGGKYVFGTGYTANTIQYADQVPTRGTWLQGDIIFNSNPEDKGNLGWVVIESGTFGTLNGGNTTGSIESGGNQLVVNTQRRIRNGDFISIDGVDGVFMVVDRADNVITLSGNAAVAASDAAVSYWAAVIETFGKIGK